MNPTVTYEPAWVGLAGSIASRTGACAWSSVCGAGNLSPGTSHGASWRELFRPRIALTAGASHHARRTFATAEVPGHLRSIGGRCHEQEESLVPALFADSRVRRGRRIGCCSGSCACQANALV